jgi:DNA polymerase III epsilon subunit-like protein
MTKQKSQTHKQIPMYTRSKSNRLCQKENPRFTIILDTETTGLIPKDMPQLGLISDEDLTTKYPYITQISFIVYDNYDKKIAEYYNEYIRIPDHVEISDKVTEITGITREKCNAGINIIKALNELFNAYMKCGRIVAHNMWYDSRMIRLECRRHFRKLPYLQMSKMFYKSDNNHVNILCTMQDGRKFCALKQWPKLANLYKIMFNEDVEKYGIPLHNSLVDVLVCLRCYLKIYLDVEIENCEFERYILILKL